MEVERYVPGSEGEIWYEHWHRYHFALPIAAGKRVIDIACGEGYGSALLATMARSVTGMDVDKGAVARARRRYGTAPGLEYRIGNCEAIPLPDASVEVVVSFETLEHIPAPEKLIAEAARVLAPGGLFLVSTPNKEVYSDRPGYRNPWHLKELYRDEFFEMVGRHFPHATYFGQRLDAYSAIWPVSAAPREPQVLEARREAAEKAVSGAIADPMYYIAACGRDAEAVAAVAGRISLFADAEHAVSEANLQMRRRQSDLAGHAGRIESAYAASQAQVAALAQERDRLASRVKQLEAQLVQAWPKQ